MPNSEKVKLNLGCGIVLVKGFINIDNAYDYDEIKTRSGYFSGAVIEEGAKYLKADIRNLPFDDNSVDYIESQQTFEHLGLHEIIPTMREIHRILKPGSKIMFSVPDFNGLSLEWLRVGLSPSFDPEYYSHVAEEVFGNQRYTGEFHKSPWVPTFTIYALNMGGFAKVDVTTYRIGTDMIDCPQFEINQPVLESIKTSVLRYDTIFATATKEK